MPGKAYTTTLFEPKATITVPDGAWRTDTPESREHLALGLQTDSANLAGVGLHRMTKVADPQQGAATISDAVDGARRLHPVARRPPAAEGDDAQGRRGRRA